MSHTSDRALAIDAALAGAEVVRAAFGSRVTAELKGVVDPVTEIDRAAERAVLDVIETARPDDAILAEEAGASGEGSRRWIVDPLDGTVNFVHAIPHVGVSVALWNGPEPLVAAVVDVMRGEVFAAETGSGATLDDVPIHVSDRSVLLDCVVGTGFPYDRDVHGAAYAQTVGHVVQKVRGIRRQGAAVLDTAWVACGRLDGFWEFNLSPWDVAAGILLVQEAGGSSADLVSEPAGLDSTGYIFSNGALGSELVELIRTNAPDHVRPTN